MEGDFIVSKKWLIGVTLSFLSSFLVVAVGAPSVMLPSGNVWWSAVVVLSLEALLPWGVLVLVWVRQRR